MEIIVNDHLFIAHKNFKIINFLISNQNNTQISTNIIFLSPIE